ncbi:MAG: hypothetical protein AAF705_03625, partial [Bacteroidota bacterium]
MKAQFLILTMLLVFISSYSQDLDKKRILRPFQEQQDSILFKVKRDKNQEIKYLYQMYEVQEGPNTYCIYERYKKNKFWTLLRYQVTEEKKKNNKVVI